MKDVPLPQEVEYLARKTSYFHELFDRSEQILRQHRLENPDLYRIVEERKALLLKEAKETKIMIPPTTTSQGMDKVSVPKSSESIYFKPVLNLFKLIGFIKAGFEDYAL